jgi:UDP-N-acetylglucosamine--dolichyl-phosphate N-acetylglucosaminephosphotransferase
VGSVVAAAATVWAVRWWIPVAHERGFVGKDMNKPGNIMVAEAGGVWAVIGAAFGLLAFEAWHVYLAGGVYRAPELFAMVSLLLLSAFLGFLDDLLGWKKGLARKWRIILMAPISLPLMVIKAGHSTLALPFIGVVNLGLLYPLVAVPIGVLGAANAFNMIAGFNGLEAGMGLLLMLFTAWYAYIKHVYFIVWTSLIMASAIAVFLVYNWYPAKVFPGNAFTYGVGAYYAALVIVGNMEKFGLLLFTLYFIKAALYFRGVLHGVWKPGIEDFGIPQPDGSLEPPLRGLYSLTHAAIMLLKKVKGKAREPEVVIVILSMQAAIGFTAIAMAYAGLL